MKVRSEPLRFGSGYQEVVQLQDGTELTLRLVHPEDAPLLLDGFQQLSAASRYMRFFGVKGSLSLKEVAYLTDVDGVNHFAIGAILAGPQGKEGVGIARFIRRKNEPKVAELAVAVVDRLQGRGLGRILLERLLAAARERGIERFRFDVLAGNARMLNLLHDVVPDATQMPDGTEIRFEVPIDMHSVRDQESGHRHPVLHRLLALVAGGLFKD